MQTMQQLGRYEILAELGRGAMGAVFRARDPRIDRTVAIKTIAVVGAAGKDTEEYRQRFFREAQSAGRLSHPGIVTIFDVGEDQVTGTPFIVMEFADGRPLDENVAAAPGGKLAPVIALDLVQQVAEALNYAHGAGIVHRDIKPSNIIVTADGRAKIADFGIAKMALTEATVPGQVLGTPAYMSPEQINGQPVDGRSDLFSLGVIAYWLLTGQKPFDGASITAICVQVVTKDPAPASRINPGLGADYDYLLSRALAKAPEMRYQRGKDLAADAQDLRNGRPPRSRTSAEPGASSSQMEKTVALPAAAVPQAATRPLQNPAPARLPAAQQKTVAPVAPQPAAMARASGIFNRKWIAYLLAVVLLLMTGAGVLALSFSRSMPATLQIVGQYPFRSAEIYIWVDGDLRYHDEVRSSPHSHAKPSHSEPASGGVIALTLPVRAGRHIVRVQVDAEGRSYDHDTAIPGQFRAYSQKTLQVDFGPKKLDLSWE